MLRVTRLKSAEGADRHPGQLLVVSESKHFRELLPGMALAFSCLCLAKAQPHPAAKQQVIPGAITTDDSMEALSHEWRVWGDKPPVA